MKLYFREKHLMLLDGFMESASDEANFVLLFGKRKVGKTTLVAEYLKRQRGIYITVSSKSSALQLNDISDYFKTIRITDSYIPSFRNWKEMFEYLFFISKERKICIGIDEFQNFEKIEPSVFNDIRELWETFGKESNLSMIAVSSDTDFISRTFNNKDNALYNFNKNSIKLTPFSFSEVVKIMRMNESTLPVNEILKIYMIFGGLPKYYTLLDKHSLWNSNVYETLKSLVFSEYAPLGYELKELLLNEFARGNKIYLSVLQAIASGKDTVTEIAKAVSIPSTSVAKYVSELENKKHLIKRRTPVGTVDASRSKFGKYRISSYYENFWFKFVQPDIISYEMCDFERILFSVSQKLPVYFLERTPLVLKSLFQEFLQQKPVSDLIQSTIDEIGEGWNRDASVDLVVLNHSNKTALLGDVIGKDKGSQLLQITELMKKVLLLKDFYSNYSINPFVISNETLDSESLKLTNENKINFLYLRELLGLAETEEKAKSKLIRAKSNKLKRTELVSAPLFTEFERVEKN